MNKYPLVDVIIPTFNRPHFLEKALKSVFNQSYPNIHVTIVDDGSSSDRNYDVVKNFPGASYLYQPNQGPGFARNRGINVTKGEFLQFLDDDDTLFPNAISLKVDYLLQHSEYGAVYTDLIISHGTITRRLYEYHSKPMPAGDIFQELISRNFIPIHSILWRRRIIEMVDGFVVLYGHEDWGCNIKAADRTKFGYLDTPTGIYFLHNAGLTKDFHSMFRGKLAIHDLVVNSDHFKDFPPVQKSLLLTKFSIREYAFGEGEEGKRYILEARKNNPKSIAIIFFQTILPIGKWLIRPALKLNWIISMLLRNNSKLLR